MKKLVDYCKKTKIFIIGVHAGGEAARGPAGSDNERMIDAVAPFADFLVVTKDSNKDGRFTKIAEKTKAPLSRSTTPWAWSRFQENVSITGEVKPSHAYKNRQRQHSLEAACVK